MAASRAANGRASRRQHRSQHEGRRSGCELSLAVSPFGSFATPERPSLSLPAAKYDVASACVGFCRLSSDGRGKLAGPRTPFSSEVPVGDRLNRITVVRVPTVRYLVETSSGELSFSIERDKPLEKGLTFTQEGNTYIARFIEPGRDDFDGVIKAEWMGKGDFPRAGARPKTEGR